MARLKKIIARNQVGKSQYQICIFKRKKNHELSFLEILVEDAPSTEKVNVMRLQGEGVVHML